MSVDISKTRQNVSAVVYRCDDRCPSPALESPPSSLSGGFQSFQILRSPMTPSVDDVATIRTHCIERLYDRFSLKSLRYFLAVHTSRRRRRSAGSSSVGRRHPSTTLAASAECSPSSRSSAVEAGAVWSSHRRWLPRIRRHRGRQFGGSASKTGNTIAAPFVSNENSDAASSLPSSAVEGDVTANYESLATAPDRTFQTTSTARLLQPPTTLDVLPVQRGPATSPNQWQVRRRPRTVYGSVDSIGECSIDDMTSPADVGQCTMFLY